MGEPVEPVVLAKSNLGAVAIDTAKVEPLPTSETIYSITLEQTRSDHAWSQFPLRTTERSFVSCPGTIGTEAFAERVAQCKAMLDTDQGKAFLAGLAADLAGKPLEARSKVEVAEKEVTK